MLRSVNDLQGLHIRANDGEIGSVDQFFFDDETWTIRHLVVDTGNWLSGRKVLISPIALGRSDWGAAGLSLLLTKEQIKNSPSIDTDKPVSRQHEVEYFNYYGYPYYWHGPALWGAGAYPLAVPRTEGYPDRVGVATGYAGSAPAPKAVPQEEGDPHLRSTREVIGYYIEATDGGIGHVEDFIIDDQSWAIRYMEVDTVNWWPGKKVVITPEWITRVSWAQSKVYVSVARETIKNAPEYDPTAITNRDYEDRLYDYYSRSKHRA
jgi:sporulation protein YlmC with PRC-barrel domain